MKMYILDRLSKHFKMRAIFTHALTHAIFNDLSDYGIDLY